MKLLDIGANLTQKALGILPPQAGNLLWFPVFVVLLLVALRFAVRRFFPLGGKLAVQVARCAVIVVGALLLALDLAAASWFRLAGTRPPDVVYAYGDAVTGAMIGAERVAGRASAGFAALPRLNFALIVLLAGLWLWAWDHGHCRDQADPGCVRPITQWVQTFK